MLKPPPSLSDLGNLFRLCLLECFVAERDRNSAKEKGYSQRGLSFPLKMRCSSALGDKRRDSVVHKITSTITSRLVKSGEVLSQADVRELFGRVSDLYHGLSTKRIDREHVSPCGGEFRPVSAASMLSTPSVTQRQIDALTTEFSRSLQERKAQAGSGGPNTYSQLNCGSAGSLASSNVTHGSDSISKPPRALPPEPLLLNHFTDMPAYQSPSPTFSPNNTFQGSPVMNLSRAASSLRSSTDMVLQKLGTSPVPSTKRLRRVARDAEEYERVLALAAAEKRERDAQRQQKMQSREAFRSVLDTQCESKRLAKRTEQENEIRERLDLEQQAEEYQEHQKRSISMVRDRLSRQKMLNEDMRMQTETRRVQEKRDCDSDAAQEIAEYQAAAEKEKNLQVARRTCQSNILMQQMKELEDRKKQDRRRKIEDLRQSKLFQKESDDILAQQELKRKEQKELSLKKIRAGEIRAQRQYDRVAHQMSDEQRKEIWLTNKFMRESQELECASVARECREAQRREASTHLTKQCLLMQIGINNAKRREEKEDGAQWASDIQRGLEMQEVYEQSRKASTEDEKRQWVHLLDAQSKLKQLQETLEVNTSIARGPSPTSSLAGSPIRSVGRLTAACSGLQ